MNRESHGLAEQRLWEPVLCSSSFVQLSRKKKSPKGKKNYLKRQSKSQKQKRQRCWNDHTGNIKESMANVLRALMDKVDSI